MVKTVCTEKRCFPEGVANEIDQICEQPDVSRVISVNIVLTEKEYYVGFVTYETDEISEQK